MADVKLSQLAANSPASVAAGASLWSVRGDICGLAMQYVSPTQLRVTSGAAWVESAGQMVALTAAVTITLSGLSASTWGHVYLVYNGAAAPSVEVVPDAPAAPFFGNARSKSGANGTSRRYLGSVKISPTANAMHKFDHMLGDNSIVYNESIGGAPFVVVNGSAATTPTTVDCSGVAPVTSRKVSAVILNAATSSSAYLHISNSEGPTPGAGGGFLGLVSPLSVGSTPIKLDASQRYTFAYEAAVGGGGCFHRVSGYYFER